jgi:hypothetical protein
MNNLNENTAFAIIFANTKRKNRNVDLLTIAKCFEHLVKLYGSQKAVANKVGLSIEMIREFLIVLKLPIKIQKLVSERRIDSIDVVREISIIKYPSKQIKAAHAFINSLSKDVRDIKRLVKKSKLPIEDAKKIILDAKPKGLHIFIMDFNDETYQAIIKEAKALKIKPAELVKGIVTNWLKQKTKKEK